MAMRRIWRQLQAGDSWVVDADISDFFGTLSHSTLEQFIYQFLLENPVRSSARAPPYSAQVTRQ
jgi:hypothetical protein